MVRSFCHLFFQPSGNDEKFGGLVEGRPVVLVELSKTGLFARLVQSHPLQVGLLFARDLGTHFDFHHLL